MDSAPIFRTYNDPAYRELLAEFTKTYGAFPLLVNGFFDLLHPGPLAVFSCAVNFSSQAASLAPVIVAINADTSAMQAKGHRPYFTFEHRAAVLAAIRGVDAVVGFNEPTPAGLLGDSVYSVLVKGGDCADKPAVGSDLVPETLFGPDVPGYHSTDLARQLFEQYRRTYGT